VLGQQLLLSGPMRCFTYVAAGMLCALLSPACGSSSANDGDGSGTDGGSAGQAADSTSPDDHEGGSAEAGAGSTPLGAGGAPDPGDVELPQTLLDAIDAYQHGGQIDLDDDGEIDIEVELEEHQYVSRVMEGGEVVLTVTRADDGTTTKVGDLNLDGEPDYREDELDGGDGFSRHTEQDRDYDGESDWRELFEIDRLAGTTHILQEVFDGDAWQVLLEGTDTSGVVSQGASATCTSDVPTDLKNNTEITLFGSVRVVQCDADTAGNCIPASRVDERRGGCSPKQANQIKKALAQLFQVGLGQLSSLGEEAISESSVAKCLNKRRPGLVDALINNIARGGSGLGEESPEAGVFSGTRFSCGINCTGGGRRTLGDTSRTSREQVNLNMSQSSTALLDTVLHEMLHSAGFDGPPDHDTAQDDYVYACAAWCTGQGVATSENPDGAAQTADCFNCSATEAAKQECCGKKTVCIDRCCNGKCGADGRCVPPDPCDPRTNDGDFSRCMLNGDSSLIGPDVDCSSHVDWRFDKVTGNVVRLIPVGGTTECSLDTGICTAMPLSTDIAPGDGELFLDFSGATPTYQGTGMTTWELKIVCPEAAPATVPIRSAWFSQPDPHAFTTGGPLPGVVQVEDGALQWLWKYSL
jgi:hypothetical protein